MRKFLLGPLPAAFTAFSGGKVAVLTLATVSFAGVLHHRGWTSGAVFVALRGHGWPGAYGC